jgi:serine protease Do
LEISTIKGIWSRADTLQCPEWAIIINFMKKRLLIGTAILLIGFLLGGITYYTLGRITGQSRSMPYTFAPNVPRQIMETGRAFSEIVRAVSPAVVNISTTKVMSREAQPFFEDPFFDFFSPFHDFGTPKKWKERSLGSGIIAAQDGYIITNNHVVEKADEIKVTLIDRRTFKGRLVGADPKTDVAVIKIDATNLPTLIWGDSDKLQVGEFVLAIGSPYGLSNTVTMGIISAVGRANVGIADYEDFIQTDAAINPGNSGGPLVNIKGEIIGMNTAIFSRTGGYQGIGFAVPSNMVRLVMDQLLQKGKVTRGWIGVTIQELTPELAQEFGLKKTKGALVSDIAKDSPAAKSGIMRGDVILEFNGKEVKDVSSLRNMVAQSKTGSEITMKILRAGREFTVKVFIVELPREVAEIVPSQLPDNSDLRALTGLTVMNLSREIIRQLGFSKDEKGVVVVKVEPGSPADDAEMKKGDVIKEINKKTINNVEDFNRITTNIRKNDSVLLFINRSGKKFYVILKS